MANVNVALSNAAWERNQKEAQVKMMPVEKLDFEITLDELLDSVQDLAGKGLKQRKLKKQDVDELNAHVAGLKSVLKRIDEKTLLKLAEA